MDHSARNETKRIWYHRVDEALDHEALSILEQEATKLPLEIIGQVRLKIIHKRRILAQAKDLAPNGAKVTAFAARYGLPSPDGRPLFAYRLSDSSFSALSTDLCGKDLNDFEHGFGPGLFVLWATEWFRREYQGGFFTWVKLVNPLAPLMHEAVPKGLAGVA
jgi:hypothetical protein